MTVTVHTVLLPTELPRHDDRWRRAETLGFASAFVYDHLTWRELQDGPWHATVPVLAAAAMTTSTIRLGTLVASANFRHPVPFAKEIMTLDDLSEGRLTLGLGAGGTGHDAVALGGAPWSTRERTDRFVELVEQLDTLLRAPATTRLTGHHYEAVEARSVPGCVQAPRVPFAVAAGGPRTFALAARHAEVWVTNGRAWRDADGDGNACVALVAAQSAALTEACAAVGRDPSTIRRLLLTGGTREPWFASPAAARELRDRYAAEAGITDLVLHWPVPGYEPYAVSPAAFEATTLALLT